MFRWRSRLLTRPLGLSLSDLVIWVEVRPLVGLAY